MTTSASRRPSWRAATPMRYMIRLSTFIRLAVFTAEPTAMPRSMDLMAHWGPANSSPL